MKTSIRTDAEPMAFTADETWAGGFWSWLTFVGLMLVALLVSLAVPIATSPTPGALLAESFGWWVLILGFALVLGGGISLIVMFCCLPIVALIARALRRVDRIPVHIAVYALLGASIGVVAVLVATLVRDGTGRAYIVEESPVPFLTVVICAVSPVVGWWRASRAARRERASRASSTV
ncbi:hypothetical protein [Microbacterium sp. SLBN-146]|uniref:hypothetical protein n=1 Tax=Microbacterium sp. SLBN-146 TaxID=2768457 RepID=UPI001151D50C|nr:hypothetical protein [Microbacterium sp. SLBN-146]TQJ32138.1 hypothetical protein FBY39_2638 [Microbacterium sp. SLBN-146]